MDLRERLKAMGVRPRVPGAVPAPPEGATERESAPASVPARESYDFPPIPRPVPGMQPVQPVSQPFAGTRSAHPAIDKALQGTWHETDDGLCFYAESRYAASTQRGPVQVGSILHAKPNALWEVGRVPGLRDVHASKLLFLDTETTGLSGGTGTYIFLVGVAFFTDNGDELVVRQYFLNDVAAERAFLKALNDLFQKFEAVVTFNGKSFDWPLLETRYIYTRLKCVLRDPPHLDMLHPSRRLWKERFESCSLETLESNVLGFKRGFDVPGWRIPALYFQYLRANHAGHVLPVFEHNEHDLLTLVALTGHVGRILDSPDDADLEATELFGLGKLYEDMGKYMEGLRAFERALSVRPSPAIRDAVLRRLSFLYKHLQQRDEAVAIWARLVTEESHLMFPYLELAKHYEHKAKDYFTAMEYTLMAQTRAANAVERAELQHRLLRVQEKVKRAAQVGKGESEAINPQGLG